MAFSALLLVEVVKESVHFRLRSKTNHGWINGVQNKVHEDGREKMCYFKKWNKIERTVFLVLYEFED